MKKSQKPRRETQYWPTIQWKFGVGTFPKTNVTLYPTDFDPQMYGQVSGSVYSIAEISINHTTGSSSGLTVRMVDDRGVSFGDNTGECERRIRKALGMPILVDHQYLWANFYIGITLKRNESFADGAIRLAWAIFREFGVDAEDLRKRVMPNFDIHYKCMVRGREGWVSFKDALRVRHGLILPTPTFVA